MEGLIMSRNKKKDTSIAYRPITLDAKVKPAKSGRRIVNGKDFEREMAKKYGQDDLIRAQ
jgi:hypothetical protein